MYIEGYRNFQAWRNGILEAYTKSSLYLLCQKTGDLRAGFLALLGLKSLVFMQNFMLSVPKEAVPVDSQDASYELPGGMLVKIYDVPGGEAHIYTIENPVVEKLPMKLQEMLKTTIQEGLKETKQTTDFSTVFDDRSREFTQQFIDRATLEKIPITQEQAMAMGREAAAWVVGLGSPIENMALDRDNITDIYIESENSPIYIEHAKYGLCHTLWRYNHEMLEHAFKNIVASGQGSRKFDKSTPVIDLVLTRLAMRCHLQQPPATFGGAAGGAAHHAGPAVHLPMYLSLNSLRPFFAGYDDVMVGLGCSEAVLGLKGVGRPRSPRRKSLRSGPRRGYFPFRTLRKSRPKRTASGASTSALCRCRHRTGRRSAETRAGPRFHDQRRAAHGRCMRHNQRNPLAAGIQGVINMLNTQPGIFLLYNLHAQSLKDIQDRLELVFGVPAASMYSTDRYSFLKKVSFGRKTPRVPHAGIAV